MTYVGWDGDQSYWLLVEDEWGLVSWISNILAAFLHLKHERGACASGQIWLQLVSLCLHHRNHLKWAVFMHAGVCVCMFFEYACMPEYIALKGGFFRHASSFLKPCKKSPDCSRGTRSSCLAVIILKEMHCICKCPCFGESWLLLKWKKKKLR